MRRRPFVMAALDFGSLSLCRSVSWLGPPDMPDAVTPREAFGGPLASASVGEFKAGLKATTRTWRGASLRASILFDTDRFRVC